MGTISDYLHLKVKLKVTYMLTLLPKGVQTKELNLKIEDFVHLPPVSKSLYLSITNNEIVQNSKSYSKKIFILVYFQGYTSMRYLVHNVLPGSYLHDVKSLEHEINTFIKNRSGRFIQSLSSCADLFYAEIIVTP
jgi:hypothetical protein